MSLSGAVSQMVAHGLMMGLFLQRHRLHLPRSWHPRHLCFLVVSPGRCLKQPCSSASLLSPASAFLVCSTSSPNSLIFMGTFTSDKVILGFISYQFMAVIAISGIVITATYCLRAVRIAFMGPRNPKWDHLHDIHGPIS